MKRVLVEDDSKKENYVIAKTDMGNLRENTGKSYEWMTAVKSNHWLIV